MELPVLDVVDALDELDAFDPLSGAAALSSPLHARKVLAIAAVSAAVAVPRNFSVVWLILRFPSLQQSKI